MRTKKGLFGQRDSRALSELYQCYAGPLYSYAFKILANHEDAEEVLQDTFRSTFSIPKKGPLSTEGHGVFRGLITTEL